MKNLTIPLSLLLILMLIAAACGGGEAPTPTPTTVTISDALEFLRQFESAQIDASYYKLSSTQVNDFRMSFQGESEEAKMTVQSEYFFDNVSGEFYFVDTENGFRFEGLFLQDGLYFKEDPFLGWQRSPVQLDIQLQSFASKLTSILDPEIIYSSIEMEGTEILDGAETYKIKAVVSNSLAVRDALESVFKELFGAFTGEDPFAADIEELFSEIDISVNSIDGEFTFWLDVNTLFPKRDAGSMNMDIEMTLLGETLRIIGTISFEDEYTGWNEPFDVRELAGINS